MMALVGLDVSMASRESDAMKTVRGKCFGRIGNLTYDTGWKERTKTASASLG